MTTDAQKQATIKYMKENLEDIRFRVKKGEKEKIRQHAQTKNLSLTAYIIGLISDDMNQKKGE